jgi:hypothetical protein
MGEHNILRARTLTKVEHRNRARGAMKEDDAEPGFDD